MSEQMDRIIELKGLVKEYDGVTVVDNINLHVRRGEFVTFLGPSGCGKTTTLRMIAGFEMPTQGEILLNGVNIADLPPYKRPVNTVFQRYALFPHLNVFDNIAFGLRLKRIPVTYADSKGNEIVREEKLTHDEIQEKVARALAMVDLEGLGARAVNTLSGGQQQRVAIARAIVNEPQILLLDEPLGALDLKMRKEMQSELKAMHRKLGITFIYVTHDQEEALTMSDTVVVMNDGAILQVGTPTDIYNEPKNSFIADFIGDSNIISATMTDKLKVKFLGRVFDCVDDVEKNTKVDVVVRPEDIVMVKENEGMINGKVISSIFKGVHYEMAVEVGKSEIIIQSTSEQVAGSVIGMNIAPSDIHIMDKDLTENVYDGYITKKNKVVFGDGEYDVDVTMLYKGSTLDEEGYLITSAGERLDLTDTEVRVTVGLKDIGISDDSEDSNAVGEIISCIYKSDHYQVIVRTLDNEEDYVADTDYFWNECDKVGISIAPEKITIKLKTEAKK